MMLYFCVLDDWTIKEPVAVRRGPCQFTGPSALHVALRDSEATMFHESVATPPNEVLDGAIDSVGTTDFKE